MTEVVTPGLGRIEDLLEDLVWDNLVEAALAALAVAAPWTKWPIVGPVVRYIVRRIADKLFSLARLTFDFQAIRFLDNKAQREFDTAAVKLKIIAYKRGVESEEFKKAREDAKAAFAEFVRLRGA